VIVRSDVDVELIKQSASDDDVVWAARVSTVGDQSLGTIGLDEGERTTGLIGYLMRNRHGSPFEHSSMTFYVRAPIFVMRELMRHRTFSFNEESGRYRELSAEFYVPGDDRDLVQVGKPGHYRFERGTDDQRVVVSSAAALAYESAWVMYQRMLAAGIAREVARMVLPVATYSSTYVTGNARALMNFLSLRVRSDDATFPSYPQREIEMVAEKMEAEFEKLMPATYAAFIKNGRVAP
jgi:thymidylate synthase (FAD)